MNKKRILLVGDGNHQYITNYVSWLKKQKQNYFIVDILSYTNINNKNKKFYDTIYQIKSKNNFYDIILKIKGIRRYYRFYLYETIIANLPKYDVVHFHFISVDSYFIVDQIKKNKSSKIILSIWGSDLYKLNSANEKNFIRTCQKADILTFTNQKTINYFRSKYKWEKNNLKLCRFGLAPLDKLKDLKTTKNEIKTKLGWNTKKIAITIGYNLSPNQQHIEILNQFENEKIKKLSDKIQLILPITYGGTLKYKKQLFKKLNHLPYEYRVYDTFLDDVEVAQIRKASDIMIQLQKTDQFSGSMQEHLFAHNIVITGSWLPYDTLKESNAWFIEIDKIEELATMLLNIMNNFESYWEKTQPNPEVILNLSSWEKNIKDWIALYNY